MEQKKDWLDRAPVLCENFESMPSGTIVRFDLRQYTETGTPMEFPIDYTHERFEFRTDGRKDAVAHGRGKCIDLPSNEGPVRILFSQYNQTATLKGLGWFEGQVKVRIT